MSTPRRCTRCLLPDTVPGLQFDPAGLCDICQVTPPAEQLRDRAVEVRRAIEATIDAARGTATYECVVAFSGGKDSSYTLQLLVRGYGLRCLAVTIDNGFVSEGALRNCHAVCGSLGVDHSVFAPSRTFMHGLYRASATQALQPPAAAQRASAICSACISVINTHVLQRALELGVRLVAGGYLAGQLPRNAAAMTLKPGLQIRVRTPMVERFVRAVGGEARRYLELRLGAADPATEVSVINPMLGSCLSEEEILAAITPLGWRRPKDTGITSTNCRLNDLGVYLHQRRHGFHAYAFEIAEQLRRGEVSREHAAAKLDALPERREVEWIARRIGVVDEL